ncbi:MAG TPA: hypothetical protein VIJ88_02615 [Candidatus Paceibacterota bacterium]
MSTYEKIASIIIGIVLVALIIFSYREIKEPFGSSSVAKLGSDFDTSIGPNFTIGSFGTAVNEQSSGGLEDNCEQLQPVMVAALHDISERLETRNLLDLFIGAAEAFEVNRQTLQLLCNKNAEITLEDSSGDKLVLQKIPFTRSIPPQGSPDDIGTEVHINATAAAAGAPVPTQPTTYGDILIPDRFLDTATSSSS